MAVVLVLSERSAVHIIAPGDMGSVWLSHWCEWVGLSRGLRLKPPAAGALLLPLSALDDLLLRQTLSAIEVKWHHDGRLFKTAFNTFPSNGGETTLNINWFPFFWGIVHLKAAGWGWSQNQMRCVHVSSVLLTGLHGDGGFVLFVYK